MESSTRLFPTQVCFVVDDVPAAAAECTRCFGWGPFHQFTVRVPEARYRDWTGLRHNDVALGMAGKVQVELVHVHEGREPIEEYQARYGAGFQHLGIACRSLDATLGRLEDLGAVLAESNEHEGIRIAFVDVPTGPAMFELLQFPPRGEGDPGIQASAMPSQGEVFALDRATIVTADIQSTLAFYAAAFGWEAARPKIQTLGYGSATNAFQRYVGRAGNLELELLEPQEGADDPYSQHLARGDHGLVHAGGSLCGDVLPGASVECEWLEIGAAFALHDWVGGPRSLQVRHPS